MRSLIAKPVIWQDSNLQKLILSDYRLKKIFECFSYKKDEIRIVGGAIRDFLLNKEISDIDLVCKYHPKEVIEILNQNNIKTKETGIKYGTISAIINGKSIQITTLRKDIENFGRDCEVEFTDDFYEDAKRRDLTINSLYADYEGNIYDYFGARDDIKNAKVRFIGNAKERIEEDYLRILRFLRFSCYFAQEFDIEGLKASFNLKNNLKKLSVERIKDEIFKIMLCPNRINLLDKMKQSIDIMSIIFKKEPDIQYLDNIFLLEKIINKQFHPLILIYIFNIDLDYDLRFSKKERKFLEDIKKLQNIISINLKQKEIVKLLLKFDKEILISALIVKISSNKNFEKLIDNFNQTRNQILSIKIPQFPVNGNDLKKLAIDNLNIGKYLEIGKDFWIDKNFATNKQEIINFILNQGARK